MANRKKENKANKKEENMAKKKNSFSWFRFLSFLSFISLLAFTYADITHAGGWKGSNTRKYLENLGVCELSHTLLNKAQRGLLSIDNYIEEHFPTYRSTVIEFSSPYIELCKNLGCILCNVASNVKEVALEKYPVIIELVESKAPGLIEHSQNTVINVWSSSVFYFNKSINYLQREVFVGQLSPENMQKVVSQAFNTTQNKAAEYYHWLSAKIQGTIKSES